MAGQDRETVDGFGEFRLIDRIRARVEAPSPPEVGIGDDAAVLACGPGEILLTTDAFVDGVHFDRQIATWPQIGSRMVTAAVSDVAAMGGEPRHLVVSLCIPSGFALSAFDGLADGIMASCKTYGVSLVGGDTVRTSGPLVASLALTGSAPGKPILRSGARQGDVLAVTGRLGGSLAGLMLLRSGRPLDGVQSLVRRHLEPLARVQEGRILAESGLVTAMIDVSDGVSSEAHHLAESSSVGIAIESEKLPLAEGLTDRARDLGNGPVEIALESGEEFELLFTLSSQDLQEIDRLFQCVKEKTGTEIHAIGEVRPHAEGVVLVHADGSRQPLPPKGYDHF